MFAPYSTAAPMISGSAHALARLNVRPKSRMSPSVPDQAKNERSGRHQRRAQPPGAESRRNSDGMSDPAAHHPLEVLRYTPLSRHRALLRDPRGCDDAPLQELPRVRNCWLASRPFALITQRSSVRGLAAAEAASPFRYPDFTQESVSDSRRTPLRGHSRGLRPSV